MCREPGRHAGAAGHDRPGMWGTVVGAMMMTTKCGPRNRYFPLADLVLLPPALYLSFVLRLDGFTPGR
ncbi:MAG TPA: hypothetical protein VIL85_00090 [Thermomicrobiales bacterium]